MTGDAIGPHLRFELRCCGVPIDLLPYLLGERDICARLSAFPAAGRGCGGGGGPGR